MGIGRGSLRYSGKGRYRKGFVDVQQSSSTQASSGKRVLTACHVQASANSNLVPYILHITESSQLTHWLKQYMNTRTLNSFLMTAQDTPELRTHLTDHKL